MEAHSVVVELEFCDLYSSWRTTHTFANNVVTLAPNSSTEILSKLEIPEPPLIEPPPPYATGTDLVRSYSVVAAVRLRDPSQGNEIIARISDWPQPYRLLEFDKPGTKLIDHKVLFDGVCPQVRLIAISKPVKCVVLSVDYDQSKGDGEGFGDAVKWSDNGIDLVPGDERIILARGLKREWSVRLSYLGGEFL